MFRLNERAFYVVSKSGYFDYYNSVERQIYNIGLI